jgi:hypothetical protein
MANLMWDQSVFNRTLDHYLKRLSEEKLPGALNKKAFFIGLRAMAETPKVNPHKIFWELQRPILATRQDGSKGMIPVGYAIAAKRASGSWIAAEEKARGRKRKSGTWRQRAWRKLIQKKFETMVGGRQRATGFIRIGWLAVVKKLGPLVKDKGGAPSADMSLRQRGGPKGAAFPARPGFNPTVTISNSAQARSDKLNGLLTVGGPALDRAFASETADMVAYLEREALKEETAKFNAANRR